MTPPAMTTPATADAATDDRMPLLDDGALDEAQRAAKAAFAERRGYEPRGPFVPLMRSPEVMRAATQLGRYLRYETELPAKISELAIIITARKWSQNYEWAAHRKIAEDAGLDPGIAEAIREGRRPSSMSADEETVYEYCQEVHLNGEVCDATYARAKAAFGEKGIIDLTAICGYYSMLAMIMNVARTPLPEGVSGQLSPFKR